MYDSNKRYLNHHTRYRLVMQWIKAQARAPAKPIEVAPKRRTGMQWMRTQIRPQSAPIQPASKKVTFAPRLAMNRRLRARARTVPSSK